MRWSLIKHGEVGHDRPRCARRHLRHHHVHLRLARLARFARHQEQGRELGKSTVLEGSAVLEEVAVLEALAVLEEPTRYTRLCNPSRIAGGHR